MDYSSSESIDTDNIYWNNENNDNFTTNNDYYNDDWYHQNSSTSSFTQSQQLSTTITTEFSLSSSLSSAASTFSNNYYYNNNYIDTTLWFNNHNDDDLLSTAATTNINNIDQQIALNNLNTFKIPQYYSLSYQMIGTLFQGIIFIVGVLGNVMVVIVVLRSRSMRTPTNCYLVSLAVADTMVLLASVPNEIISYYLLGDRWIWGPFGCALFIFLQYLGINASSLSIAAFTVERYIAICHPMLAHKLCTVRRAKRIIMYVWMFATTYCAPWLFLTKTERIHYLWVNTEVYTCKFKLNREYYKGYYLTDIVLFYILPLLISCVLYALIARILYKSKDLIISTKPKKQTSTVSTPIVQHHSQSSPSITTTTKSTTNTTSTTTTITMTTITAHSPKGSPLISHQHSNHSNNINHHNVMIAINSKKTSHDSSRVQVVKMLAVVVAVFATLWLPYRALVVYNSFSFPPFMELWYLMFAKTMIFVNSAINPIIYSACSMKFRREFKRMLTCGRNRRNESNNLGGIGNYHHRYGGNHNHNNQNNGNNRRFQKKSHDNNNTNDNIDDKNGVIDAYNDNGNGSGFATYDSSTISFTMMEPDIANLPGPLDSKLMVKRQQSPSIIVDHHHHKIDCISLNDVDYSAMKNFQKNQHKQCGIKNKSTKNNDKAINDNTININIDNDDVIDDKARSNKNNTDKDNSINNENIDNKKYDDKLSTLTNISKNIASIYNDQQQDGQLYYTETIVKKRKDDNGCKCNDSEF